MISKYALRSDLSDFIKVAYFDNIVAIAANGSETKSIPFTMPSGYKFLAIANAHAEGFEVVTFNLYISGNDIIVNIRNLVNSQVTKRVIATVLLVKS